MKDSFFSIKKYKGTYTPIYPFESYGDTTNYFIALEYVCNRDDYQTLKTAKGTALNFKSTNVDGDLIFADISDEHLEILKARNYTLQTEAQPETMGEDGRLVSVTEIYVYEPNIEFVKYNSTIVPVYGLQDDSQSATANVVVADDAGNIYRNLSGNSIVKLDDVSEFKTGEYITFYFTGKWFYYIVYGIGEGVTSAWLTVECEFSPTASYKILAINGNYVEVEGIITPGNAPSLNDPSESSSSITQCYQDYSDSEYFFAGLNNECSTADLIGMWASACRVEKEYSYRAFQRRLSNVKETLTVHKSTPTVPTRFAPCDETGTEYTTISRWTTTTPAQWNAKVAAGDWYVYTEPELTFNSITGLYELTTKTTQCV